MNLAELTDTELLKLYKETKDNISRNDAMQYALKIAINSAYGMLSNPYCRWYSVDMAEAITLSGQLAVKWVCKDINGFLNKVLGTTNVSYQVAGDTDSVAGDSVIYVNGNKLKISDFYDECSGTFLKRDDFNKNYVKQVNPGFTSIGVNAEGTVVERQINYVMKHTVKKRMFRIKTKTSYVDVTEDHSIIVKNKKDGRIHSIKPDRLDVKKHHIINIIGGNTDTGTTNEGIQTSVKMA